MSERNDQNFLFKRQSARFYSSSAVKLNQSPQNLTPTDIHFYVLEKL